MSANYNLITINEKGKGRRAAVLLPEKGKTGSKPNIVLTWEISQTRNRNSWK